MAPCKHCGGTCADSDCPFEGFEPSSGKRNTEPASLPALLFDKILDPLPIDDMSPGHGHDGHDDDHLPRASGHYSYIGDQRSVCTHSEGWKQQAETEFDGVDDSSTPETEVVSESEHAHKLLYIDMYTDMRAGICRGLCQQNTHVGMRADLRAAMRTRMRIDMCTDMCLDMYVDMRVGIGARGRVRPDHSSLGRLGLRRHQHRCGSALPIASKGLPK